MAKKVRSVHECSECGYSSPKWLGRCPECGSWGSMEERTVGESGGAARAAVSGAAPAGLTPTSPAVPIGKIVASQATSISTGIGELDRVLGNGIADDLRFESAQLAMPTKAILRIDFRARRVRRRRLAINGALHDQLVNRLQSPLVADQLPGQIIEQLGMRRRRGWTERRSSAIGSKSSPLSSRCGSWVQKFANGAFGAKMAIRTSLSIIKIFSAKGAISNDQQRRNQLPRHAFSNHARGH